MLKLLLVVFTNLFIGRAIGMLSGMPLKETTYLGLLAAFVILAIFLTGLILLPKEEGIKMADEEIKEGEVYQKLSCFAAREAGTAGVIGAVRNNKTKKLRFFIFNEEPPGIFKKEDGKLVPYK
jgi:hypothetical protein